MRKSALLIVLLGVVTASCTSDLGRAVPGCVDAREANGAHIIEFQAVPSASLVPCIRELPPGWDYIDLVPQQGRSRFHLDSDRIGDAFLEVTAEASCDVGAAEQQPTDEPATELFVDVLVEPQPVVQLVVVPVNERHLIYGQGLLIEMTDVEIRGRTLVARIDDEAIAAETRIARALAAGAPAFSVGDSDVDNKTMTLHLPGRTARIGQTLDQALDEVDDDAEEMRYRAVWYYRYEGGCTTYEFDAEGRGALTVADDAGEALGFFAVAPVLEFFQGADLPIGDGP
jgi:hypothetical protein